MELLKVKLDQVDKTMVGSSNRFSHLTMLFVLFLGFFILIIVNPTGEAIIWHEEGRIHEQADQEYRGIAFTDLEDNRTIELWAILKDFEDGAPAVEFFRYNESWENSSIMNIPYNGLYNDIAILGPYVAGAHAGGNSADVWFYNTTEGDREPEFIEPDVEHVQGNHSLCVDMADLNNDGYPDIVAGYNEYGIRIFYGNANGRWEQGSFPKTSGMVKTLFIVDVNNDTYLDILNTHKNKPGSPSGPRKIELWLGDGAGNWTKRTVVSGEDFDYSTIASADLNGDGYLDIIAASDNVQGVDRYLYQPDGSFWERGQIIFQGSYYSLLLADINEDNRPDLIGCRFDDQGINIHLGKGDGNFTTTDDFGPVQNGNVWAAILLDFNGDGHIDILVANVTGLYFWTQVLPEVENISVPATMYAMSESYNLSVIVASEALVEDIDDLVEVKLRLRKKEETVFTLTYKANGEHFFVEDGSGSIMIDNEKSVLTDLDEGRVMISYHVFFKWSIGDIGQGNDTTFLVIMKEKRASTGWVEVHPGPWKIISSIDVGELSNGTFNPGSTGNLSGTIYYLNSTIKVADQFIQQVTIHADGQDDIITTDIENGTFSADFTIPDIAKDFEFWPEVRMDRGEGPPVNIPFPDSILTVHSDFVIVTDLWITGGIYHDQENDISWQRSGGNLTFRIGARYSYSRDPFDGTFQLTDGKGIFNATIKGFQLSYIVDNIFTLELVPINDSAGGSPYGPMLRTVINEFPRAVWDGEAPLILDFSQGSLVNGSEVKAEDTSVSIIVSEQGIFEANYAKSYGMFTLFWSIIQNENTTMNGSGVMVKARDGENYTFSLDIPLSLAKTDNIVKFWFKGNDSVGNEFLSNLIPVDCTEPNPATVLVDPTPPSVPIGLNTNVGDAYIEVRWKPNNEDDLAGYRIYRSTDGVNFSKSPISGLEVVRYPYFMDKGLQNGKTYYYRITAVDRAVIPNESDFSEITSATPKEDKATDLQTLIKDNILIVFILMVVLAIVVESVVVVMKSRSQKPAIESPKGMNPPVGSQPFPPPSSFPGMKRPTSVPTKSSTTTTTTTTTKHPVKIAQPQSNLSKDGPQLPQIDWTCPSCTKQISLSQGERFCTKCGYKVR